MKLFSWAIIGAVSISGQEEAKKPKSCDLNELILPENALGWICSENSFYSNDLILKSGKCSIDCQDGYIATSDSRRVEHKCGKNGWVNQNSVLLRCALDLENAYEKIVEELEMTKAIFDEELEKRDAIIDGLLIDNTRLNSEMSILNNETTVKFNDIDGWKAVMDLNIETAQVERNENRASLESYDLTCQKCTGSANPSIDPWDSFSTNGVKITVDIGHCGFESVSKVQTWLTCSSMCWVATGAESVYNLSPTGFEIYLYQTDGEGLNRDNAVNWNYELHYEITGNC